MRVLRICAALAVGAAVAGCAANASESVAAKNKLVIGIAQDKPGLSLRGSDGTVKGFDVDVARYVAKRLGAKDVTLKVVSNSQRESALEDKKVDLMVSTYSITPERKTKVLFGGPYYVAHQDILVRAGERGVKNVRDLRGRKLCQVNGSVSWQRVIKERGVPAIPVAAPSYGDCLTDLVSGRIDAISTDDLILAGFAGQRGNAVRFVNYPFSDEKYGVGIRSGDVGGCEAVNKAITEMYQDGTAASLLDHWFGATGLKVTTTVPQFEGCS